MPALQFKPPILAIMASILVASLFISLGQWQLDRADEKKKMLDQIEQGMAGEAIALPELASLNEPEIWRYRKVYFEATPLHEHQFLLDNQIRNQRVGFDVLTLFRLESGKHILVNRGWLPLGSSREVLPDVKIAPILMRIEGYLYTPYDKPFQFGISDEAELNWPCIISYLDFDKISQRSGISVPAWTVRLDARVANGYQRDWPPPPMTPNKHMGYAVQWFALATAVVFIFLLLNVRRKR